LWPMGAFAHPALKSRYRMKGAAHHERNVNAQRITTATKAAARVKTARAGDRARTLLLDRRGVEKSRRYRDCRRLRATESRQGRRSRTNAGGRRLFVLLAADRLSGR